MKKIFVDKTAVFLSKILRPYAKKRLHREMNNINYYNDGNINFKRRDAFLLLTNHSFDIDSLAIGLVFKKLPIAIASRSLLVNKTNKFRMKFLARVIPKAQGVRDLRAMKRALRSVRKGRALMIMPEGEVTYFGNTLPIDKSIASFVKKLNVDVVTAVAYGGHISKPRWASYPRENQYVEIHYDTLIRKEKINELSIDEIYNLITDKLDVKAFEWQREKMIKVGGQNRAEGLAEFLYKCPECGTYHSIETRGNDIICIECNTKGYLDEYGFIQGFRFDNTVDWNEFQKQYIQELKKCHFKTTGIYVDIDYDIFTSKEVGQVVLEYGDDQLIISGSKNLRMEIKDIEYFRLTQGNVITFDYQGNHYYIKIDSLHESFLQVCS
ncbi:1-acyl-sn-glycerol-3-phosphate acyltransferase [Mycoplasmatota bacterium zrk1]